MTEIPKNNIENNLAKGSLSLNQVADVSKPFGKVRSMLGSFKHSIKGLLFSNQDRDLHIPELRRDELYDLLASYVATDRERWKSDDLFPALKQAIILEKSEGGSDLNIIISIFKKGIKYKDFRENIEKNSLSTLLVDMQQLLEDEDVREEDRKKFIDILDKCYNKGENVKKEVVELTKNLFESTSIPDDLADSKLFKPIFSKVKK
ncbi:hypothetical protein HON22_04660 [Candidatus Peregrinibacteria bacterium]|jgi:hypothetical protein|nr:hypothetical protein [Candidatus Peregrinibacteria bacterium]